MLAYSSYAHLVMQPVRLQARHTQQLVLLVSCHGLSTGTGAPVVVFDLLKLSALDSFVVTVHNITFMLVLRRTGLPLLHLSVLPVLRCDEKMCALHLTVTLQMTPS